MTQLKEPPLNLSSLTKESSVTDWNAQRFRRFEVTGNYDYDHEMVLRNRRKDGQPGVHVLTPIKLAGTEMYALVDRGFAPLQYADAASRPKLTRPKEVSFIGLIKESASERFLAPSDPDPQEQTEWVDGWLRVNIPKIQKQLPYTTLPVYLEIIPGGALTDLSSTIIEAKDEKAEIFLPKDKLYGLVASETSSPPDSFPMPEVSTLVPPSRHLGYVFEWGALACLSLLIGLILQFRPPRISEA